MTSADNPTAVKRSNPASAWSPVVVPGRELPAAVTAGVGLLVKGPGGALESRNSTSPPSTPT